jgi:magnesium-transporting ATPase (P-type)
MNRSNSESDDGPLPKKSDFYNQDLTQVVVDLQSSYPTGLQTNEIDERLRAHGYNEVTLKSVPKWLIFLRQFNSVIIYILIVAAILTLLMGHYSDAVVIGLVVIVNALIGYIQEVNASNALDRR